MQNEYGRLHGYCSQLSVNLVLAAIKASEIDLTIRICSFVDLWYDLGLDLLGAISIVEPGLPIACFIRA